MHQMHVLAGWEAVVPALIGLATSAVLTGVSVLLAPKGQQPVADNRPPILTDRGSPLPMLIGRRRLPGFLCWAGDRQFNQPSGGGKSLFGGGGGGGGGTYFEAGWHVLCVGPACRLNGIYEGGKAIWTGDVTPANSPSGTHLHTKAGEAYIYWGEFDQPANTVLANRLGTSSAWPCICYIFWNKKNLGGQAQWPDIQYDITAGVMDAVLQNSPPWMVESALASTGNTHSLVTPALDTALSVGAVSIINEVVKVGGRKKIFGSDYAVDRASWDFYFHSSGTIKSTDTVVVTFDTAGDGTDGPNPAHVLWQILAAPAPWGCAIDPAFLDGGAFEDLGTLLASEHQPAHVLASGGISGEDLVNSMLMDLGVALPQVGEILVPAAVRHQDAGGLPVVTDDMLVIPAPAPRQQAHEAALPDRLVFVIKDRANNFRDMDLVIDDDSQANLRERTKQQRIEIPTVIDRRTGMKVAQRRMQEILTNTEKYRLEVARGARTLRPGQAFILDGYGQLRVASVELDLRSRTARMEAVIDQYSGEPGTYTPGNIDDVFNPPAAVAADADLVVMVMEVPAALSATPALAVARVRANSQVNGAVVWLSADGVSYTNIGTQNAAAAGGTLQADLPADTLEVIEQGPVITAYNTDIEGVQDLSSKEVDWRSGSQLALIGGEIFFLRNVTAVTGGWRLDGLIRARYDTDAATHASGSDMLIVSPASLKLLSSSLIRGNTTLYVKTQPIAGTEAADLSTVDAVTVAIASLRALRPLPPDNFIGNRGDRINEYSAGGNVDFTWTYRVKDGQGRAANEQGAGNAIGAGAPGRDGNFRIRIRAMDLTLRRTIDVTDDTGAVTYSNADLVADFGSEPASFIAELADVSGSYESTTRSVTITKR